VTRGKKAKATSEKVKKSNHQSILEIDIKMEVDVQDPKIPHAIFPLNVPPRARVARSTLSGKRPLT
jgi:hypothetical protein